MAADGERRGRTSSSPLILVPVLVAVAMLFATMTWFGARREMAALYGLVRSVEFPWVNKFVPHMEYFKMDSLRDDIVPAFSMIYSNSVVFGLFFTALILLLMMLALTRLDRFSIMPHIRIKSQRGRTYKEIMERMAVDEPSVQFFLDYDILDLPTTEGTARQPMKADELLLYTNSIRYLHIDQDQHEPPSLELDSQRLKGWMAARFGPTNPFIDISKRRLLNVDEIHQAVDDLSWYAVLILYPSLYRVHAFSVEGEEGYKSAKAKVDKFISGIWIELNGFKKEFKDGIELGFSSGADREERNALYRSRRAAKRKKSNPKALDGEVAFAETDGSSVLDNLTELGRWFRRGRIERGEVEVSALIERSEAGPRPNDKKHKPEHLLFFGEVLSERGPYLESVKVARQELKTVLTRHLGTQTKDFPVQENPDDGLVEYREKITNAEQKAFNTRAQERLATAVQAIERVLFSHQFEFSVVGGALEATRKYGIMPPNFFRWLRFSEETTAFWWFVQNLGMPAAYPENAGHYEHYQTEKAMGVAVEQPHIETAIEGIKAEASRYLVDERVEELRGILGRDAVVADIVKADVATSVKKQFDEMIANAAQGAVMGTARGKPVSKDSKKADGFPRGNGAAGTPEGEQGDQVRAIASRESIMDAFNMDDD